MDHTLIITVFFEIDNKYGPIWRCRFTLLWSLRISDSDCSNCHSGTLHPLCLWSQLGVNHSPYRLTVLKTLSWSWPRWCSRGCHWRDRNCLLLHSNPPMYLLQHLDLIDVKWWVVHPFDDRTLDYCSTWGITPRRFLQCVSNRCSILNRSGFELIIHEQQVPKTCFSFCPQPPGWPPSERDRLAPVYRSTGLIVYAFEGVMDKAVHDCHGLCRYSDLRMYLLQHLEDAEVQLLIVANLMIGPNRVNFVFALFLRNCICVDALRHLGVGISVEHIEVEKIPLFLPLVLALGSRRHDRNVDLIGCRCLHCLIAYRPLLRHLCAENSSIKARVHVLNSSLILVMILCWLQSDSHGHDLMR